MSEVEDKTQETAELTAQLSDAALVNRTCAGDETAFEELFNRHRRRVAIIASRFFRHREQIEEIIQESFAKAYFALKEFNNAQDQSFAAWLARIAFNVCYDELRRLARRPENSLSELSKEECEWLRERIFVEPGRDIEKSLALRDLADKLLARLSPEDRLVLIMLDVEGMSIAEISQATRWSQAKVKVRAHRARAALRRVLSKLL